VRPQAPEQHVHFRGGESVRRCEVRSLQHRFVLKPEGTEAQASKRPAPHAPSTRNDAPRRLRRPATRTFVSSVALSRFISHMT
jgi:hypothetical protein